MDIHHFTSLDSTNSLARQMAQDGAKHATVIHADTQTGGRGRAGRAFCSPVGGLYFSIILRPDCSTRVLPLITLAVGIGLCNGLKTATASPIRLKWPNDLFLYHRKLGGILTESDSVGSSGRPDFIITGIGLNLTTPSHHFSSALAGKVITLFKPDQPIPALDSLLQSLVVHILFAVEQLTADRKKLLCQWRELDYLQGRELEYDSGKDILSAVGMGLADDGRYLIRDRQGKKHAVLAGDLNPISLADFG